MIWRVGLGNTSRIWDDPWLPRGLTQRQYTPMGPNLLTFVNDLIDPVTGQWDKELIEQTFWSEDALAILSIPTPDGMDDTFAWYYDRKGMFSVRSAYRLYCDSEPTRKRVYK